MLQELHWLGRPLSWQRCRLDSFFGTHAVLACNCPSHPLEESISTLSLCCVCIRQCAIYIWQVLINVVSLSQLTPPVVPRAHKKSFPGGAPLPQTPPNESAAVAASAGQEGQRYGHPWSYGHPWNTSSCESCPNHTRLPCLKMSKISMTPA